MRFRLNSTLAVGTFLVTGTWIIAPAASGASGRKAQSSHAPGIAVDHAGGNSQTARKGDSGVNPMYESKDKANLKPNAEAAPAQYKDPEDMTTRYRPGNNKTTRSSIAVDHAGGNGVQRMDGGHPASGGGSESGMSAGADATARQKKHLAGVKYEDRNSGSNSCKRHPPPRGAPGTDSDDFKDT
jgi:hypothetical protein